MGLAAVGVAWTPKLLAQAATEVVQDAANFQEALVTTFKVIRYASANSNGVTFIEDDDADILNVLDSNDPSAMRVHPGGLDPAPRWMPVFEPGNPSDLRPGPGLPRRWFLWRVAQNFSDHFDDTGTGGTGTSWRTQADYVLLNAALLGLKLRQRVPNQGQANPINVVAMRGAFGDVKADPANPRVLLGATGGGRDYWCE